MTSVSEKTRRDKRKRRGRATLCGKNSPNYRVMLGYEDRSLSTDQGDCHGNTRSGSDVRVAGLESRSLEDAGVTP